MPPTVSGAFFLPHAPKLPHPADAFFVQKIFSGGAKNLFKPSPKAVYYKRKDKGTDKDADTPI